MTTILDPEEKEFVHRAIREVRLRGNERIVRLFTSKTVFFNNRPARRIAGITGQNRLFLVSQSSNRDGDDRWYAPQPFCMDGWQPGLHDIAGFVNRFGLSGVGRGSWGKLGFRELDTREWIDKAERENAHEQN